MALDIQRISRAHGHLLPVLAVAAALLAQLTLLRELRTLDAAWVEPPPQQENKWNPELFRALSFGQLPAAIDWLLLRVLIDPSYFHVPKGKHPPAYFDLDLATDLDPAFFELYSAGAPLVAVARNDGPGARDLLIKGEEFRKRKLPEYPREFRDRYWSRAWSLPLTLSYVYLFELEDLPSAARVIRDGAEIAGAPPHLQRLADRLAKRGGEYEVGLRLLNFMLTTPISPESKRELERKRDSLYLSQYLFQLNDEFQAYLAARPAAAPSREALVRKFREFLKESSTPAKDPWGGELYVDFTRDPDGRVNSTTPRIPVMGLY